VTVRAVSFDVHGTLVLPHPSVGELYAEVAADHGVTREAAELDVAFLPAFKAVRAQWDIPYGRDEPDARRFWYAVIQGTFGGEIAEDLQSALFERFGEGRSWRVLPGARESIAMIRDAGIPVVGCSNFDARVRRILDESDLALDRVFTSAEVGAAKPDPSMLHLAADFADCTTGELVHVGDHPHEDGDCAAACGATWLPVERERGIDPDRLRRLLDAPRG